METMRVYRIEDDKGVGPYNSDLLDDSVERMRWSHQTYSHPAWAIDFGRWPNEGEVCGFKSMKDMFRWFGGYLPILLGLGYSVNVYEVPWYLVEVGRSNKQVIFQMTKAKRVDNPKSGA